MKRSKSILATVALGSLLAAGATTVSMARELAGHRAAGHELRCNDGPDDRGFGGFSATPDHSFMGPGTGKDWGTDWGVNNWAIDPFWGQEGDGYYQGMAYIVHGRHGHSMGKSVRHGAYARRCL
jgi:hypothetical protein